MKQTLMQARQENKLTSRQLAQAAGVELRIEFVAEIGGRVEEAEAKLLLEALSKLTGKQYTLQNVQINIRNQAHVQANQLPPLPEPGLIAPTWKYLRQQKGLRRQL